MTRDEVLKLFVLRVPNEYPKHMLCYFAANAARGITLPFLDSLVAALAEIDTATPGYAREMVDRIAAIPGTGEQQYEAVLQILGEIYVVRGVVRVADRDGQRVRIRHEPGGAGEKNPECDATISGVPVAVEVKTPKLIQHGRLRAENPWQVTARMPREMTQTLTATPPRDNPVKDFLISADAKFSAYELFQSGAFRLLVIIWDDFCNEPIAALVSPVSGLLTPNSFNRDAFGAPVRYPNVDGVIVVRHQHQLIRATRCEPLVDGLPEVMAYHHTGFPPKAFIQVPGGREIPPPLLDALGAVPLADCMGAEYQPSELIMWIPT